MHSNGVVRSSRVHASRSRVRDVEDRGVGNVELVDESEELQTRIFESMLSLVNLTGKVLTLGSPATVEVM